METDAPSWPGADPAPPVSTLERHQADVHARNLELRAAVAELAAGNAALTVAHDRYRTLYDRAPVAYATVDQARVVVEANDAAAALFATPRDRLIGAALDLFIDDFSRRGLRAFVAEVFAAGQGRSADLVVIHTDDPAGSPPLHVAIDGVVLRSPTDGEPQCVLALHDVSARRAVESARRRAQDEVLAIVSHDLRGPLNAIVLACDALRAELGAAEREACVAGIERAASRCVRMLKDLLGVVHIESGELALRPGWFDAGELIRSVAGDHQPAAAAAGNPLTVAIGDGDLLVYADRDRLHQAIANLIANALVHARGAPVELGARRGDDVVVLTVADRGPGIPLADQAQVFDRFRQLGRDRGGAGLGLAIARGLVAAQGGTLTLVSAAGDGARFEITLPRHGAPPRL